MNPIKDKFMLRQIKKCYHAFLLLCISSMYARQKKVFLIRLSLHLMYIATQHIIKNIDTYDNIERSEIYNKWGNDGLNILTLYQDHYREYENYP